MGSGACCTPARTCPPTRATTRLKTAFAHDEHAEVEATWDLPAHRRGLPPHPDRATGKKDLQAVIDDLTEGVPTQLTNLITLGRTLKRRALDVLAYFDHPGISNSPTAAINGRLEHLRGTALGFHDLVQYVIRVLLDTGGLRTELRRHLRSATDRCLPMARAIAPRDRSLPIVDCLFHL